MNKRYISFIVLSIIILSFFLRIYNLDGESLWYDEAMSIDISKKTISDIIYVANVDAHPPLYYIILHFWIKIFGDSEFSVRFPSIIFGILSVYMIFKLGELIFNRNIGLLCSFILSISLYHIRYSQEARSYSLLVLLVLLSNYFFIKILENREKNKEKDNTVGYIISSITMLYTHIFGLFYLLSHNIYYLISKKKNIKLKSWIVIQSIILSFFILWLPFILGKIERSIGMRYIITLKTFPTFNSIYGTFKIFAGNEEILYIFIIAIIIGLAKLIKGNNEEYTDKYIFILLWLFLPIMVSIIISYTIGPLYMNRYFIGSFPALILLSSKSILEIKKISIIFILLIIVLQIPLIGAYYDDINKEQWRDVANYIKDNKKENDTLFLYPNFIRIPFSYYYKNSDYVGINNSIDIKNDGDRIWLVLSHVQEYPERKKELVTIERKISESYIQEDNIRFNEIKIYLYIKK